MNRYKFCTSANSVSNLLSETNQTVIGIKFRGISFLGLPLETDQTDFCANIWVKVYWVVWRGEQREVWIDRKDTRILLTLLECSKKIFVSCQYLTETWSHSLAWSLLADTTDTDCIYKNVYRCVYEVKGMSHETCVCCFCCRPQGSMAVKWVHLYPDRQPVNKYSLWLEFLTWNCMKFLHLDTNHFRLASSSSFTSSLDFKDTRPLSLSFTSRGKGVE